MLVSISLVDRVEPRSFLRQRLFAPVRHEVGNSNTLQPRQYLLAGGFDRLQDHGLTISANVHSVSGKSELLWEPDGLAAARLEQFRLSHAGSSVSTLVYIFPSSLSFNAE